MTHIDFDKGMAIGMMKIWKMLEKLHEVWEFRTIQFRDGGADGVVEKVAGQTMRIPSTQANRKSD